ncbi:DUF2336 domain-containing protein [Bradyrhizobium canariense]|uniref:DUF2336 domain-containing protein n=1 Tax=Bradyrhizobium canariense TaxID=255045 RepID=A0A1X3G835_9BRAD|nr:DUF2336 domain-containing protein [Bradyrhizobium canariense]OSI80166.1 hypothetical protein BSZ22_01220 [Bradyrhizobium canariense]OSI82454.1 hypothetical protein BSZ23_01480 [Bradyrhizobium canariense]OSI96919.1 hypothetical protein BSZ25_01120 [Bradyrhizobium canariense]OSI98872.1 hypothetical protein BSZ24_01070 [Bradyrhizobium canariense]OSJ16408.1 hypothetical protein BSZ16_01185 [Bradyrhizobium canariense]
MRAPSAADLITELDAAIAKSSSERCARMLWRTTELLADGNHQLQELQVGLLDDVLIRLARRIAPRTLAEFSTTLAELGTAPMKTLRRLASSGDPAIAVPILTKSPALSPADLVAIATSGSEDHLLAIAGRRRIESPVTEAILQRGSSKTCLALIGNSGAEFSGAAYAHLIGRAVEDDEITKALTLRPDTPDMVVRELLSASPRPTIKAATASAPSQVLATAKQPCDAEYAAARPEIISLNRSGKLSDSTVNRFAIRRETANLFTALSVLSGAPIEAIEQVMAESGYEGAVMACRASRLNWQTTLAVLNTRGAGLSPGERVRAQELFETLHLSTSQWSVRWGEISARAHRRTARSAGK